MICKSGPCETKPAHRGRGSRFDRHRRSRRQSSLLNRDPFLLPLLCHPLEGTIVHTQHLRKQLRRKTILIIIQIPAHINRRNLAETHQLRRTRGQLAARS